MNAYTGGAVAVLAVWQIAFFVAARFRRNDIADVIWGPGFLVAAGGAFYASSISFATLGAAEFAVLLCVAAWAVRLSAHIGKRFLGHGEDTRYATWRKEWGSRWLMRSYLQVFLLQALFLFIISLPILRSISLAPREFTFLVALGVALWIFGFMFESVADEQLRRFKSSPANKGRVMDQGLWSWSRHPNYFGEVVQWWGVFLMAVEPGGWWLIVSPITITFLILKVSGIPMLEKLMRERPGFQAYSRRTSLFLPRPPRHGNSGM